MAYFTADGKTFAGNAFMSDGVLMGSSGNTSVPLYDSLEATPAFQQYGSPLSQFWNDPNTGQEFINLGPNFDPSSPEARFNSTYAYSSLTPQTLAQARLNPATGTMMAPYSADTFRESQAPGNAGDWMLPVMAALGGGLVGGGAVGLDSFLGGGAGFEGAATSGALSAGDLATLPEFAGTMGGSSSVWGSAGELLGGGATGALSDLPGGLPMPRPTPQPGPGAIPSQEWTMSGLSNAPSSLSTATTAASALSPLAKALGISDEMAKLLGIGGSTLLGALGSSQQSSAAQENFDKYWNAGAPFRGIATDWATNPQNYFNSPFATELGRQSAQQINARSNVNDTTGRAALNQAMSGQYLGALGAMGNLGSMGLSASVPFAQQQAQSSGNLYNVLGSGLNDLVNPKQDIAGEFLKMMKDWRGGGSGQV